MIEINAILAIANRDLTRFLRDRTRIITTFIFPFIFIGVLGGSLEAGFGEAVGYSFLAFVFTGIFAQTLFQSTALGIISLIEDRDNNFSQEIFVSPISRYSIILGKIVGESLVALTQGAGIIVFGLIAGVPLGISHILGLIPVALAACLLGGSFGILVLSNLGSQRAANQVFPFIFFPQLLLAGVFAPIKELPFVLHFLSRMTPMTYAVDLVRGVYYSGTGEFSKVVLFNPIANVLIMFGLFIFFLTLGTYVFIQGERNK